MTKKKTKEIKKFKDLKLGDCLYVLRVDYHRYLDEKKIIYYKKLKIKTIENDNKYVPGDDDEGYDVDYIIFHLNPSKSSELVLKTAEPERCCDYYMENQYGSVIESYYFGTHPAYAYNYFNSVVWGEIHDFENGIKKRQKQIKDRKKLIDKSYKIAVKMTNDFEK